MRLTCVVLVLLILAGCTPRHSPQIETLPEMPPPKAEAKKPLHSTGWRLLESIQLVASNKERNAGVLTFENPYARFYVAGQTVVLIDEQTANLEELYHTVLRSNGCLSLKVTHYEGDDVAYIVQAISAVRGKDSPVKTQIESLERE